MIFNSMLVIVVVINNIQILEPHHLTVAVIFYLIDTSLQGAIYFHQHHDVIGTLHYMNMEVLAIY